MRRPTKQVLVVDVVAVLVIGAVAMLATIPSVGRLAFGCFPVVTLLVFYFLGKSARDLELRLWEKRHPDPSTSPLPRGA
jgi:hypothetical protein